jgi:hypothetical protein
LISFERALHGIGGGSAFAAARGCFFRVWIPTLDIIGQHPDSGRSALKQ